MQLLFPEGALGYLRVTKSFLEDYEGEPTWGMHGFVAERNRRRAMRAARQLRLPQRLPTR